MSELFTEAAYMDGTQSMAADNIILDIIGGVIFIKVFLEKQHLGIIFWRLGLTRRLLVAECRVR